MKNIIQKPVHKILILTWLCILTCILLSGCSARNKRESERSFETENASLPEKTEQTEAASLPDPTDSEFPEEAPTVKEEKEGAPFMISFTGDVYLSDALAQAFRAQGVSGIADAVVLEALTKPDLTVINHEYACTNETNKVDYQLYNFRSAPENEHILRELGVDIAGLSNNHILDYGLVGMMETIESLHALGIDCIGAGSQIEEAKQAAIKEINGKKIAIVAASHFVPSVTWHASPTNAGILTTYEGTDNYQVLMDYITELKSEEKADIVIIFAHFGIEKQHEFVSYQQQLSHAWIDAGADLIVGSHAHVLQGIEQYNGKYIFYNLGNFLFGSYAKETMVLQVEIREDNNITPKIVPCLTENFYVRSMEQEEAERLYRFLEQISVNIVIDEKGIVSGC